jgi:hypothetical protein
MAKACRTCLSSARNGGHDMTFLGKAWTSVMQTIIPNPIDFQLAAIAPLEWHGLHILLPSSFLQESKVLIAIHSTLLLGVLGYRMRPLSSYTGLVNRTADLQLSDTDFGQAWAGIPIRSIHSNHFRQNYSRQNILPLKHRFILNASAGHCKRKHWEEYSKYSNHERGNFGDWMGKDNKR